MAATRTRTRSSSPPTIHDRATAYAEDVVAGRVVAGPHVRNACRRHLDDLVKGPARGLKWDLAAASRCWRWWENILKLNEGQFEGKPFLLHPSQAFKLGCLFGWKRQKDDGSWVRRFRKAYIEEGKGNGKSPFAGGLGLYMLTADGEKGAQVYSCGARKEQANILFADAVKMARQAPALYPRRLRFSGGVGNEYNIAYLAGGGSFFRPISREAKKSGSGPRPHCALADELHEHPDRKSVEMLERGFKFRLQPLLVMITNSGSDRNSYCWEEHQHAVRVAAGTMTPDEGTFAYVGEVIDDTAFSYVCALDPGDDPLEDPSCWVKANPLLHVILEADYLAGVVRDAKAMPGKLNGILRLHFCVWTDSETAWISRAALERVLADFDPAEHAGKEVSLGVDLSGTTDLTAVAHVVETGTVIRIRQEKDGSEVEVELPTFDAWVEAWTPKDTLEARALKDQAPYDVWVREGHLQAPPGKHVRFDYVAAHVARIGTVFLIRLLAFDRYAFAKFEEELAAVGVTCKRAEHPQAGRKKGKAPDWLAEAAKKAGLPAPDGLWMPASLNALEELILDERIRLKLSPVLISACMSAAVDTDPLNNRWLAKDKATQRIDPAVSLCMAVGAALMKLPELRSVYEQRGLRTI